MPVTTLLVALALALAAIPAARAGDKTPAKPAAVQTIQAATPSSESCACTARKHAFMDRKLRERAAAAAKKAKAEPGS